MARRSTNDDTELSHGTGYMTSTWRYNNKPETKAKKAQWYRNNKSRISEEARLDYAKNRNKYVDKKLRVTYNITLDDYNRLLELQSGVCAICRRPERDTYRGRLKLLAVDHCHNSGRIRGLLCNSCNKGLGLFQDSQDALDAAIVYLSRAKYD